MSVISDDVISGSHRITKAPHSQSYLFSHVEEFVHPERLSRVFETAAQSIEKHEYDDGPEPELRLEDVFHDAAPL